MIGNIIVVIVVIIAILYLVKVLAKSFKKGNCACSSCPSKKSCSTVKMKEIQKK